MPLYAFGERIPRIDRSTCFIAPDAQIIGSVEIGREVSLWFGCIVRGDNDLIQIGDRCNLQDQVVVHTDEGLVVRIGAGVSIGHRALLHGCTVETGALIGIGAVVLNRANIGAGSLVGANSLVTEGKEIPPGVLVFGNPARVIRDLTPEDRNSMDKITEGYVLRARQYAAVLHSTDGI
jgi:carbonic anhydrase/acetyltransferase-like protein (isoleucine patch superfamily)